MSDLNAQAISSSSANNGPSAEEDFSFLYGRWHIQHRKLLAPLSGEAEKWAEFEANSICIPVLAGIANVEEMRESNGILIGSAMRIFDLEKRQWSIYWVSARDGLLQPPVHGKFADGVGTFIGPDTYMGKTILVRFIWKKQSTNAARWDQAFSTDAGETWEINWTMQFERVNENASLPW
jgi:hypothetical protein